MIRIHRDANHEELVDLLVSEGTVWSFEATLFTELVELCQHEDGGHSFALTRLRSQEAPGHRLTIHFRNDIDGQRAQCTLLDDAGLVVDRWTVIDGS